MFHATGWLEALRRTYGYEPVVFTSCSPSSELSNGIVFSRVNSWLRGSGLVSGAFADHCQPLASTADELESLISGLVSCFDREKNSHLEFRPLVRNTEDDAIYKTMHLSASYCHHSLDLRPCLDEIFRGLHKDCIQRKTKRAKREALEYEEGCSESLLLQFYSLVLITRQRHGVPPQPFAWFRNLRDCLPNEFKVRVISRGGTPLAAMITLHYKQTLVYKYGGSDARFHNLGAMPLLFWRTIENAKQLGIQELDLGRSDLDNTGLIAFKSHLGAVPSPLNYYTYPRDYVRRRADFATKVARSVFAHAPKWFCKLAGSRLYRHVG